MADWHQAILAETSKDDGKRASEEQERIDNEDGEKDHTPALHVR